MTTAGNRTEVEAVRRRNHGIHRRQLTEPKTGQRGAVPIPLFLTVTAGPVVVLLGTVSVFRPRIAANLGMVVALALGIFILLSPCFVVPCWRRRRALRAGARAAAPALPAGAAPYGVGFGLSEDAARDTDTEPTTWNRSSARFGAAALTASALHLRGPDGTALDIALTDILGTVHTVPTPWLDDGSLDVRLHTGEAIELCAPRHKDLASDLTSAGVRVIRASAPRAPAADRSNGVFRSEYDKAQVSGGGCVIPDGVCGYDHVN
ncbi:hypothetical protein [Streptomyces sp. NPDC053560]|uniref:hypothetical protein n=1 Tax=Streptomyces sp. NPDC053560 TaxID=3365711 RepID=UPI0037CD11BC